MKTYTCNMVKVVWCFSSSLQFSKFLFLHGLLTMILITYNQFEGMLKSEHQKSSQHVAISTCEQVALFQIIQACTCIMKFEKPINPIEDGGGKKMLPSSFPSATSSNVGISPKNFWLLVLNFLPRSCKLSRPYLVPVPNYWTWTKNTS